MTDKMGKKEKLLERLVEIDAEIERGAKPPRLGELVFEALDIKKKLTEKRVEKKKQESRDKEEVTKGKDGLRPECTILIDPRNPSEGKRKAQEARKQGYYVKTIYQTLYFPEEADRLEKEQKEKHEKLRQEYLKDHNSSEHVSRYYESDVEIEEQKIARTRVIILND